MNDLKWMWRVLRELISQAGVAIKNHFATLFIFGIWILIAAWLGPKHHILNKAPNEVSKEIVTFEATFYMYLAALTITTMSGLLIALKTSTDEGPWRRHALDAIIAFSVAITLVTIGYAIRVDWMNSIAEHQAALQEFKQARVIVKGGTSSWVVGIDKYFDGPLTAISYIIAIAKLVLAGEASLVRNQSHD